MIKVTIEFTDPQAVVDFFAGKSAVQTAAAPAPTKAPTPVKAPAAPKAEKPTAPAAPAIEYPTLQKAVFALAADNKEAVMGLLAQFFPGVENASFKTLDPSRYAEALAAVQAKHAELKAAAAEMA